MIGRPLVLSLLAAAHVFSIPAAAQSTCGDGEPTHFVHNRSRPDLEDADRLIWLALRAALDRTCDAFGPFEIDEVGEMPPKRRAAALASGEDGINIAFLAENRELSAHLVPVRVPVDRGLLGYRILLIRKSDQPRFAAIESLGALRAMKFGSLATWDDSAIMSANGIQVVDGNSYDGLFKMLVMGRFAAFSRSIREVAHEYGRRNLQASGLAIERHLLLHYPMPVYFWLPNTEQGRRQAERVRRGLEAMVADGELRRMFDLAYAEQFAALDLKHRMVIELANPLIDPDSIADDDVTWFTPQ